MPTTTSLSHDPPVADVNESSEMAEELSHTDISDILSQLQNSGLPDNTMLSVPKGFFQRTLESGIVCICFLYVSVDLLRYVGYWIVCELHE